MPASSPLCSMAAKAGQRSPEAVREFEALNDLLGRIVSYAGLLYAADTSDPKRQKFYGDIQEKITAISSKLLFFGLEFNRLDDAALEAAMANAELGYFRPWIEDLRKEKPYQLDDKLEQLFHEKAVTARGAWDRLFNETMTSLRFSVDGEKLSLEPTLNRLLDQDGTKRRRASEALAKVFKENLRLFTLITNTLAKDKEISDRWRGFADVADARNLSNRVEKEVVDALVSSVRAAYPRISHRYYAMKAGWLGTKKLAHWDRNAPLPEEPQRVIGWDDARETVLRAYGDFSPRMAGIAGEFFAKGWIDAPVREGKSPGAFSHPTVPSAHPYILLNYQGKPRDVMTLAHELGHGVHQVLANKQGPLMAPTPLTLAETASVFGEMLTFRALLDQAPSKRERKAMLAAKVEDMINTVVRQIAFYSFERAVHTERREGELTSGPARRDLDGGAAREPRPSHRLAVRLRDLLGLHPAFHPLAVLRLRLRLRRLPGELALCASTRRRRRASPNAISTCWRPAAPSTIPSCSSRSGSTPAIRSSGSAA